jgi:hypothetical protein
MSFIVSLSLTLLNPQCHNPKRTIRSKTILSTSKAGMKKGAHEKTCEEGIRSAQQKAR